jgi:hypothetical protein
MIVRRTRARPGKARRSRSVERQVNNHMLANAISSAIQPAYRRIRTFIAIAVARL